MSRESERPPVPGDGLHHHPHRHPGEAPHRHPHHHAAEPSLSHAHPHPRSFERLTYIDSPLRRREPRAKVLACLALVLGVVLAPPLTGLEFALLVALFLAVTAMARLPLRSVAGRSLLVVPFAGGIALLSPLREGLSLLSAEGLALMGGLIGRAWVCTAFVILLAATTPPADLLLALKRLRLPHVFVLLLAFIYRYVGVMGRQLHALRTAIASRAPHLRGLALLRVYGNLAGNLFVRAYERGERVHAAMLSRGFDGTLPTAARPVMGASDILLLLTACLGALAVAIT